MIDIHSHILHGIDDGPGYIEESLEMARLYVKAGFTGVVATPHYIQGTSFAPESGRVIDAVAAFNRVLERKSIDLRIYSGMEIVLDEGLQALLEQKKIIPLAGSKYLLIETPFQRLPVNILQMLLGIRSQGYEIVLAHPERCMQLGADRGLFEEIFEAGIYLQVNFDSFVGGYGKAVSETAFYLLRKGYIHFLATDSHDPVHRQPGSTPRAIAEIEEAGGAETVEIVTRVNPGRLIEGLPLETSPAIRNKKKKRRWFCF